MEKKIFYKSSIFYTLFVILLLSCNSEKKDWEEVYKKNSTVEYQKYITENPKSKYIERAKECIKNIHLQDAVEFVIFVFAIEYAGPSTIWNPTPYDNLQCFSDNEIERFKNMGYDYSLPIPVGIVVSLSGSLNKLNEGVTYTVKLTGKENHEITILSGEFGVKRDTLEKSERNYKPYLAPGTKVKIDGVNYHFDEDRLKLIK